MLTRYQEHRTGVRRFARRVATVSIGAGKQLVTCVIWDISEGGARLAIALQLADLAHHFISVLRKDRSVQRHCEVVWSEFVGVKFTERTP